MILSIEQHVEWITSCSAHRDSGHGRIDPAGDAQDAEVEFVNQIADFTCSPSATRGI
ncbi:MAG: hypothetical protein ABSH29_07030 [Acidimicrobiales bacterium]|jgi:hypothetical protein